MATTFKTQLEELNGAIDELHAAMVESLNASECETIAKQRKEKAHYRLLKAKEAVRALEIQ